MPVSSFPDQLFCMHGHIGTSHCWLQSEACPSMPARPGVLPALHRSRIVTCRKSVMVKRDRSLCPASVRAVCRPLLLSCAAAEASGVCHRPGDIRKGRNVHSQRLPGLHACPGCSGCRSAACGTLASALAFQLAHHLRARPAVISSSRSVLPGPQLRSANPAP